MNPASKFYWYLKQTPWFVSIFYRNFFQKKFLISPYITWNSQEFVQERWRIKLEGKLKVKP